MVSLSEILSSYSADAESPKSHMDLILKLKAPKVGPPGFAVLKKEKKKERNFEMRPNKLGEQVFTCVHA